MKQLVLVLHEYIMLQTYNSDISFSPMSVGASQKDISKSVTRYS